MDRDTAYKILYNQETGGCNHSSEIISIFTELIKEYNGHSIRSIDRWNIYDPDSLHIVYHYKFKSSSVGRWVLFDNCNKSGIKSGELVCPITDFASRYRQMQLDKLEI